MDLYVIAGPNGSGKTTFAQEFLPNYADCNNFVNADLIARHGAVLTRHCCSARGTPDAWRNQVICPEGRVVCI